jgi:tRNA-(ms[2]io[6]A)-hydroxylase|tara:strand:- start:2288 stop:2896 length:609 start_codon:yes stop_codon:yes gene_type:complete
MTDISEITEFLGCPTSDAWVQAALADQNTLLIDHANCEKKAAGTALNLMYRYISHTDLLNKMSRLAREELRHFEMVLAIMGKRGIEYEHVSPSRYAAGMRKGVRTHEPAKVVDTMIVGAIIEARSCERFAMISPYLDDDLGEFYTSLLRSESRHYKDYLDLALSFSEGPIDDRIAHFIAADNELISSPDTELRFHSGVPTSA